MFGKPEWFAPRKFGWGLGLRTKEGAIYVAVAIVLFFIASALPLPFETKMAILGIIGVVITVDILHIMMTVYSKLDEREERHQALAERNAGFVAVVCLVAYILFITIVENDPSTIPEKMFLPITILVGMSIVKGATLVYLERKG